MRIIYFFCLSCYRGSSTTFQCFCQVPQVVAVLDIIFPVNEYIPSYDFHFSWFYADVKPASKTLNWNHTQIHWLVDTQNCHQIANISRTSLGNKFVRHSDAVGASPVGTAPTTVGGFGATYIRYLTVFTIILRLKPDSQTYLRSIIFRNQTLTIANHVTIIFWLPMINVNLVQLLVMAMEYECAEFRNGIQVNMKIASGNNVVYWRAQKGQAAPPSFVSERNVSNHQQCDCLFNSLFWSTPQNKGPLILKAFPCRDVIMCVPGVARDTAM